MVLRSNKTLEGKKMAGARALWRANGMEKKHFGKPVIAVVKAVFLCIPALVIRADMRGCCLAQEEEMHTAQCCKDRCIQALIYCNSEQFMDQQQDQACNDGPAKERRDSYRSHRIPGIQLLILSHGSTPRHPWRP